MTAESWRKCLAASIFVGVAVVLVLLYPTTKTSVAVSVTEVSEKKAVEATDTEKNTAELQRLKKVIGYRAN